MHRTAAAVTAGCSSGCREQPSGIGNSGLDRFILRQLLPACYLLFGATPAVQP